MPAVSRVVFRPRAAETSQDRGAVTVEAAVALAAVAVVLATALTGMGAVLGQLRCTDAAREAARLIARGAPDRAAQAVDRIAPGARMTLRTDGDTVRVEVRAGAGDGLLPGVRPHAEAFAVLEPGTDDSADSGADDVESDGIPTSSG